LFFGCALILIKLGLFTVRALAKIVMKNSRLPQNYRRHAAKFQFQKNASKKNNYFKSDTFINRKWFHTFANEK